MHWTPRTYSDLAGAYDAAEPPDEPEPPDCPLCGFPVDGDGPLCDDCEREHPGDAHAAAVA